MAIDVLIQNLTSEFWAILSFALVLVFIVNMYRARMRRLQQRIEHQRHSQELFAAHFHGMKSIMRDNNISDDLKKYLLVFSEAISDKEFADYIMTDICNGGFNKKRYKPSEFKFSEEFKMLAAKHPNTRKEIEHVINSGIYGLFLKWPETAKAFEMLTTTMSISDNSEVRIVKSVQDYHPLFGPPMKGAMIPAE